MIDLLSDPILKRLTRLRSMETDLLDLAEDLRSTDAADPQVVPAASMVHGIAAGHGNALTELFRRRGTDLVAQPVEARRVTDGSVSTRLEHLVAAAAAMVVGYEALYAAGRLQYEVELCDLADAHAAEWAGTLQSLSDLVPAAVHAELLEAGMTCRCMCPACGIGACLCTRNSIETIREHWGRPGLEPSDGIELRISPRPGSQLADASLESGDRVLTIDGEVVHTNSEMQRALRRHPLGEAMPVQVARSGRTEEIGVARVSDRSP